MFTKMDQEPNGKERAGSWPVAIRSCPSELARWCCGLDERALSGAHARWPGEKQGKPATSAMVGSQRKATAARQGSVIGTSESQP
jgi:hypothetical protein